MVHRFRIGAMDMNAVWIEERGGSAIDVCVGSLKPLRDQRIETGLHVPLVPKKITDGHLPPQ
jgi:hypothetical protein